MPFLTFLLFSGSSKFVMNEQLSIQDNAKKLATKLQTALSDENELAEVLGMIKYHSQSQSGVLPFFMEDFCTLISHETKIVRNIAYELFVKLLRFDPNLSQQLIVPFIGCLESNDASIAGHAMEKLPDVAPLAQVNILQKKIKSFKRKSCFLKKKSEFFFQICSLKIYFLKIFKEHLETVLNTAFNLGLYSNIEVVNPICDTLNLMNGLAGY